jgi:hypothetical protein
MTKNTKMMLAAAAMGGLLAGATSRLSASTTAVAPTGSAIVSSHSSTPTARATASRAGVQLADGTTDKHDCKGQNSCKGKGGCKTGDNGCKGKNSCKSKGGCEVKLA